MNDKPDANINPLCHASRQDKRGFSLLELFVAFALTLMVVGLLVALFLPVVRSAGPAARRMSCGGNFKQIALALYNYADVWNALPPAYTVDADGNPLHSWRTLILPYLEHQSLYETIDLSKPWNDPANARAAETRVSTYNCPSTDGPTTHTTYLAIVAPDGCFLPNEPRQFSEITAEHGETLMIIEVDSEHAVHWMSPVDADEQWVLSFGPTSNLAHSDGLHAAFVDGSVRFLSVDETAAQRRDWISITAKDD